MIKPAITFTMLDSTGWLLPHNALPKDCVSDCSGVGSVDGCVDYWVNQFTWNVAPDKVVQYLKSFGAWEIDELLDHEENLKRLLWSVCCDIKESESEE
jgi:hypothetical protein